MLKIWRSADKLQREALGTVLLVFAVGFGLSFYYLLNGFVETVSTQRSGSELIIFALAGYGYVEIAFRSAFYSKQYNRQQYTIALLSMIGLITIMQILAGDFFFLWLLALPLAAEVDTHYPRPPLNLLFYALILASVILPLAYGAGWSLENLVSTTLMIGSGLVFVIVFSRLRRREQESRLQAERLTHELEAANRKLALFATQAEELATTKERNRIAREIHDNLGHYLTVVNMQLEAGKLLIDKNPEKARAAVGKAQQMTREGLQAIRQSIGALRVSAVENRPITQAIDELCKANQAAGIATNCIITGEPRALAEKTKLTLYRLVQEGLTNSRKHSQATQVNVTLDYSDPAAIGVSVRDNGMGSTDSGNGFGLLGLNERVNLLGGSLDIQTAAGEGFAIIAQLPTDAPSVF